MIIITDNYSNENIVMASCVRTQMSDRNDYDGKVLICFDEKGNDVLRVLTTNFPNLQQLEVAEIPVDFKPYKYCYTKEKGFYLNPNWVEPTQPAEKYTLDEVATMIASEVNR